jgi:hypothetical protein
MVMKFAKKFQDMRSSRTGWKVAVCGLLLCRIGVSCADTVLLSDTTLISGTETADFSFTAPGPGTVSVTLTNIAWPQTLSNLNFLASTPSTVLSSWSTSGSQTGSFGVSGSGTYFADVQATAQGPMNLGVYSLELTFSPQAPVPLPASSWLLLAGLLTIAGWLRSKGGSVAQHQPLNRESAA